MTRSPRPRPRLAGAGGESRHASAGNQTPEKTLRNVLRMLTLLNRPDIPVAGGAWKPLMRDLIIADNVHGESGLDGLSLPEPAFAPQNFTAVELMASVLRESQSR